VRSPADACLRAIVLAAVIGTASIDTAGAQERAPQARAARPADDEISKALADVKADPNLATERTIRMLHWSSTSKPEPSKTSPWYAWIADLFRWIGQSARALLWCAAALLAGLLVVYIVRLVRAHAERDADGTFVVPTHVRDLDIRPETLPPDIGAAARRLWERGEHRAALALLYRGLLSRLAHVHRVPIRDSSTEGDCLALASMHLAAAPSEYSSRLVRVWQRSVYGREDVPSDAVYMLCDHFAAALDAPSTLAATTNEGTA